MNRRALFAVPEGVSWLFILNPNLTDDQVHELIRHKVEHQQKMAAIVIEGAERIASAEGLPAAAKLDAMNRYVAAVGPLIFF